MEDVYEATGMYEKCGVMRNSTVQYEDDKYKFTLYNRNSELLFIGELSF